MRRARLVATAAAVGLALAPAAVLAQAQAPATPPSDYDARVRDSFAAAEAFQGPLEGGWTLLWRDEALYQFRFADHDGVLEAVWGVPGGAAPAANSGVAAVEARTATRLRLSFEAAPGLRAELDMRPAAGAGWTGALRRGAQVFAPVRLVKASP